MRMQLPKKWQTKTFSDVAEIITGTTPSKKNPEFYGGNIPFITPSEICDDGLIRKASIYLSDTGVKKARLVSKNTILVTCIGTLGKVGIANQPLVTNQQINSLLFDTKVVFPKYAYFYCKTIKPILETLAPSTTIAIINKSKFSQIKIPIPPLSEQNHIAAILDKADAIRHKRRKAIQLADEFLRSVFLDMFGDPALNPNRFPLIQLDSIFSKVKPGVKCGPFGSALKKNEYEKTGVPVWTMDNIQENEFIESGCLFISQEKYNELKSYFVENGDILISRAGTVGKMCVVHDIVPQSIISTNLIRLSLDSSKLKPIYFTTMMNAFKGRVGELKTGAEGAYTFMNTSVLKNLKIPLPRIELQDQFANIHKQIIGLKARFKGKNFDNLFNSLSQRAFRGEL